MTYSISCGSGTNIAPFDVTDHNKIFVAPPLQIDLGVFYQQLLQLEEAAEHNDDKVVTQLQNIVPTYHPNRKMLRS